MVDSRYAQRIEGTLHSATAQQDSIFHPGGACICHMSNGKTHELDCG